MGNPNTIKADDYMVFASRHGVFVGAKEGACIQISIPATTENDFQAQVMFIDLPLMSEECYKNFVKAISILGEVFE